jgi:hypothetical protein
MEFMFADIFFSLMGRVILFVRFLDEKRVRLELTDKYDDSYTQAGRLLMGRSIAWILLFAFATLIIAAVYGILHHNLGLI